MLLLSLLAACGDNGSASTTALPTTAAGETSPAAAAEAWFVAVGEGRATDATRLVVADQLAILVAIENGLGADELSALLADAVPAAAQRQYWESFAASFAEFAGDAIENLQAGEVDEFPVDGRRFAVVRVGLAPGAGSTGFVVAENDGRWWVDLLATLAPALGGRLRSLATGLAAEVEGDVISAALAGQVPSLRAAVEQPQPDADDTVLRELEALVRFLAPSLDS